MATITETLNVQPLDGMHMKLNSRYEGKPVPHPPTIPKPKYRTKIDPQRALEPARKKLTTLEAQRIMAVLVDSIRRSEIITALPHIMENVDRYKTMLGSELTEIVIAHKGILSTFLELQQKAEELYQKEEMLREEEAMREDSLYKGSEGDEAEAEQERPMSAESTRQSENVMTSLAMVAKQMQQSCKNILRLFALNPAAMRAILEDGGVARNKEEKYYLVELKQLKEIIMSMLLTTPVEEIERNDYLKEVSDRDRENARVIDKLEADLNVAIDDKDNEIRKKNDIIRRLQADLHQIERFSEEHNRRTKTEAEKQEAADVKNSEGKKIKLQQETNQLKSQLSGLTSEHRESESQLRKKKFKVETEVENWIQKYDNDMGERQDEFEEIDAVYTEEKKQLNELEERFKTLETEYTQIIEERRIANARREAAERELQMAIKAATTIQAFWRSHKVRKALKSKKKKGGKKKK